jgi:hypothetical protein
VRRRETLRELLRSGAARAGYTSLALTRSRALGGAYGIGDAPLCQSRRVRVAAGRCAITIAWIAGRHVDLRKPCSS